LPSLVQPDDPLRSGAILVDCFVAAAF
jgi:hypothetical protein